MGSQRSLFHVVPEVLGGKNREKGRLFGAYSRRRFVWAIVGVPLGVRFVMCVSRCFGGSSVSSRRRDFGQPSPRPSPRKGRGGLVFSAVTQGSSLLATWYAENPVGVFWTSVRVWGRANGSWVWHAEFVKSLQTIIPRQHDDQN